MSGCDEVSVADNFSLFANIKKVNSHCNVSPQFRADLILCVFSETDDSLSQLLI